MEKLLSSVGGRKFFITLGCGIVTSILVWNAKIDGTVYASVIIGTVGAFITGNVIENKGSKNAASPE